MDKYVDSRDTLFLVRAIRYANFLRKHAPVATIRKAVEAYVLDAGRKQQLLDYLALIATTRVEKVSESRTQAHPVVTLTTKRARVSHTATLFF